MAFLVISRSCLDTLMEKQFLCFLQSYSASAILSGRAALKELLLRADLNDWELSVVKLSLLSET